MPCAAWHRGCQIPDVRTGCPALPSFPGFPLGRIPSSAVRDFYCQSAGPHKGFRREVQDSFFIHMTSAVYPLCTATFHRAVHTLIHRICGRRPNRRSMVFLRGLAAGAETLQKVAGHPGVISPRGRQPMSPDPAQPRPTGRAPQIAARERSRARIRAVTAAAGLASLVAAGGLAASLPGSTHATATSQRTSGTSSGSGAAKSSGSGSASSSGGLQGTSAPSSSSGSGQVTSGGS
jgi:hypothetical protein